MEQQDREVRALEGEDSARSTQSGDACPEAGISRTALDLEHGGQAAACSRQDRQGLVVAFEPHVRNAERHASPARRENDVASVEAPVGPRTSLDVDADR